MLQALKEEPPLNTKCKDKFLIQSTVITPDKETLPLSDIWASPEANEEGKVFQQKLRVTYLPPEGQVLEEEEENQVGMTSVMSDSHYDTVRQQPAANGHHYLDSSMMASAPSQPLQEERAPTPTHDAIERETSAETVEVPQVPTIVEPFDRHTPSPPPPAPAAPVHDPEPEYTVVDPIHESEPEPTFAPAVEEPLPVPPPVPAPVPVVAEPIYITRENPVNEELYAKYQQAKAEIERLQSQVSTLSQPPPPSELRRRTRRLSDADSAAGSEAMTMIEDAPLQQEGVPLQVVVIIALGVFVTTYLFF